MLNNIHFESGLTNITDLEGFIPTGLPVGIELHRASKRVIESVIDYANEGGKVFIDSGAFEAFRNGRTIDFTVTVNSYKNIASRVHPDKRSHLFMVAPDVLDDQIQTLLLQTEHKEGLKNLIDLGVNVLTPIQRGPRTFTQVYQYLKETLGTDKFSVSVPSNKFPWSWEELSEFVVRCKPKAIHFLGISHRRPHKYFRFKRLLEKVCGGDVLMTSDACSLRSTMRKGHDLLKVIDSEIESRMNNFREVNEDGDEGFVDHSEIDFTEYIFPLYNSPGFLSPQEAEVLGFSLGFEGKKLKDFVRSSQMETDLKYHRKMMDEGWFDFESCSDRDQNRDEVYYSSRLGYVIQHSLYSPHDKLRLFFDAYESFYRNYRKTKYLVKLRLDVRKESIQRHYTQPQEGMGLVKVGQTNFDISPLLNLGYDEKTSVKYLEKISDASNRSKGLQRLNKITNKERKKWIADLQTSDIAWIKEITGLRRNFAMKLANYFDSYDDFFHHIARMNKAKRTS